MNNLAGLMDRRVRLEAKTSTVVDNVRKEVWNPIFSTWGAKKDETTINETGEGKQIVATGRTSWTLRWRTDISVIHRLVDETPGAPEVIYNIEGISEVGRREAIKLQTKRYNS
jgi:hypothetical protein